MIPHALVLEHVCGPICRLGLFAQRPSPSGGEPRLLGPLGNPSVENHDFSLLPPRATHGLVSTLPYRYSRCDNTWGIMRRVHQLDIPKFPMFVTTRPISSAPVHVPVPVPVPVPMAPICDPSSVMWLAGSARIPANVTQGPQGPHGQDLRTQYWPVSDCKTLGSALPAGVLGHPFIRPRILSINSFIHSLCRGSGCQGGLMQGAYHISTESIVLGPSGQANFLSIIAGHAVPRTERHDHSQPHNRNSTQKRPGLEQISGIPMS